MCTPIPPKGAHGDEVRPFWDFTPHLANHDFMESTLSTGDLSWWNMFGLLGFSERESALLKHIKTKMF